MATKTAAIKIALPLVVASAGVASLAATGFAGSVKADYTLSITPVSGSSAPAGVNQSFTVTMTPNNGYKSTVALTATLTPVVTSTSSPSGATAMVSPASVDTKTSTSAVTVTTTANSVGSWSLKVTGNDGSSGAHDTQVASFSVTPQTKQFAISATPPSAQVLPGDTAQFAVNITRTNYSSGITITPTGLPSGTSSTLSPANPVSGNAATLQLVTTSATPSGTYTVTISATGPGGAAPQSATVQLVVSSQGKPFSIGGAPAAVKLLPGMAGAPVALTLTNPNNQNVNVTNITVVVTGTDKGSACGPENFSVKQLDSSVYPLALPKNGSNLPLTAPPFNVTSSKLPVVTLQNLGHAQDGCQNAQYFLSYTGAGQG